MVKYGVISYPYFPVFGLNTEIQSEYRKIRTRNSSVCGHFFRNKFWRIKQKLCTKSTKNNAKSLAKAQKRPFYKIDTFSATDNKGFWQTVKFLFPNKVKSHKIVDLVKTDKLIDDDEEIAKISNKFINLYLPKI